MVIKNQIAYGMGYRQSEGGVYKGEKYSAYSVAKYLIHEETKVRSMYLDSLKPELRQKIRNVCEVWGNPFLVSGKLDDNGRFEITDVSEVSADADVSLADFGIEEGVDI